VYQLDGREDVKITRTMAKFATLLVNLSEQADKITQENLAMQQKLVRLTWALFIVTVVLAFVGAVQICLLL
jgi:hypothetical protein